MGFYGDINNLFVEYFSGAAKYTIQNIQYKIYNTKYTTTTTRVGIQNIQLMGLVPISCIFCIPTGEVAQKSININAKVF